MKLEEARYRLGYINQHRELALALCAAAALTGRLLGLSIPGPVVALLLLWFFLSVAFVQVTARANNVRRLERRELAYFAAEILLITALVYSGGGADWLGVALYTFPLLYANVVLSREHGYAITALAAGAYAALAAFEANTRWAGFHWPWSAGDDRLLALAASILGRCLLLAALGYTSAQFARMLNAKATALNSANRDLRRHQTHLEEIVEQRTAALTQAHEELTRANQELRRLNELKSNFVANVSHELRTPLTSIRCFSEILLMYPEEIPETRMEFIEIIKNESERLTRLINDVLDLSKIEYGRLALHRRPLQVEEPIRTAVEAVAGWAESQGIAVRAALAPNLPAVKADPDRLVQVVTNLISNAVKFTPADRAERIVEIAAWRENDEVWIAVSDSGPGIPEEERERIFDKFYQMGDALVSKPAGAGLGLCICREIMEQHGGRIWAENRPEGGARLICALRAEPSLGQQSRAAGA